MTAVLMIVAGSYDAKIFGFECRAEVTGDSMGLNATPVFAYTPHTGCVKTVALSPSGHLLASGSTDEHIKLYDLKKRKELGDLLLHQGAITGLSFHGKTHLLSSSEDGTVCVWRAKDWESLKVLRGHKQGINSLGLHPTGRLALSVSRDRTMRTWNLLKGRCAYITRLPAEATQVVWTPGGTRYATLAGKRATLYSVEKTGEIGHVDSSFGPLQAGVFLGEDKVALGTDDGHLLVSDVPGDDKAPRAIKLHTIRIKGLVAVASPFAPDRLWLVSAATDGSIKVWDVDALLGADDDSIEEACILSVDTHSRLTCLHAVSLVATALHKGDDGGVDLDEIEGQEEDEQSGSGDEEEKEEEEEGASDSDDDSSEGQDDSTGEDSEDTDTRKRPAPKPQHQQQHKKHAPAQQKQKAPQQQQKQKQQKQQKPQQKAKAVPGKAGKQQGKQSGKGRPKH